MKHLVFQAIVAAGLLASTAIARNAAAAPEWVDRPLVLPKLNLELDASLAVGHYDRGPNASGTGPGLDFEAYIGIIHHLQLGFRQGVRLTDDAKVAGADNYGRMYDLQAFGTGGDTFANPEASVRYQFIDTDYFEMGVDGRLVLPFSEGTRFAFIAGVPLAVHLPHVLRLDTGGYIGFGFYDPTLVYFHIPASLWIQVSQFYLGPVTALNVYNQRVNNVTNAQTEVMVGFGFGYQPASWIDLKFLPIDWPAINRANGASNFGFSAGVSFHID